MSPLDATSDRPLRGPAQGPLTPSPEVLNSQPPDDRSEKSPAFANSTADRCPDDQVNAAGSQLHAWRDCINTRPVINRIFAVMMHTTRYAFKAQARLAADCGVSPSTISRLLTGFSSPSFVLVDAVTKALEKQLGVPLDPRELVSVDGDFPTRFTCDLCRCGGCLPYEAWDEDDHLRPEYKGVRPGEWTLLSVQSVRKALLEEQCTVGLSIEKRSTEKPSRKTFGIVQRVGKEAQ